MDGRMLSVHKSVYGGCGGEKLYYMTRLTFSRKILPLGGKQRCYYVALATINECEPESQGFSFLFY